MRRKIVILLLIIFVLALPAFTGNAIASRPASSNSVLDRRRFVALGDSITYGYLPQSDGDQMINPWPSLVAEDLGFAYYDNLGISGSTLAHGYRSMSERLDSIPRDCTVLSVWGGTNDYTHDVPLGTIDDADNTSVYGALNVICSYVQENLPSCFVFLITPYQRRNDSHINTEGYSLIAIRDAVLEIGEKYSIPVLDMYTLGRFDKEFSKPYSDGLHPSQSFVKSHTAPQIADFIKRNYK